MAESISACCAGFLFTFIVFLCIYYFVILCVNVWVYVYYVSFGELFEYSCKH